MAEISHPQRQGVLEMLSEEASHRVFYSHLTDDAYKQRITNSSLTCDWSRKKNKIMVFLSPCLLGVYLDAAADNLCASVAGFCKGLKCSGVQSQIDVWFHCSSWCLMKLMKRSIIVFSSVHCYKF